MGNSEDLIDTGSGQIKLTLIEKISLLRDRCKKRSAENYRPPFEQEAYAKVAAELQQIINEE